jgi:hypothetical protein
MALRKSVQRAASQVIDKSHGKRLLAKNLKMLKTLEMLNLKIQDAHWTPQESTT